MTPKLRKLVMQNVGAAEIQKGAVEEGMLTLRMDGLLKVMKGIMYARSGHSRDCRLGAEGQGRARHDAIWLPAGTTLQRSSAFPRL